MKAYSQAQVRVVKGEEGGESKVEINGTPEAIWKVCHGICIIENLRALVICFIEGSTDVPQW